MSKGAKVHSDPVSGALSKTLDKTGLGMRAKLIIIFLVVKIIPLVILASLAWNQFILLGNTVQEMAVSDATEALNSSAVENIERMTTDTANRVADFLYDRDEDIRYAATLKPGKSAYSAFVNSLKSNVVDGGKWALAENGMQWVQTESAREAGSKALSRNEENLDNDGWHSRPAEGFSHSEIPVFDEITFIDTKGKEKIKIVSADSTKKNFPMDPALKDISKRENTYVKSEDYWADLKELQPGAIYVSDVKGAYVPSHFIGMYTPKQMVIAAIGGVVTALDASEEKTDESKSLQAALADIKDSKIVEIEADATSDEVMMQSVIAASLPLIDEASAGVQDKALTDQVTALKEKISGLKFDPVNEAYAGEENPLGKRFEGIVRWATPVTGKDGKIIGYVTLALNHDHIMEFVDHQTPMDERYTDLPSAFEGNYAFIWDYNCRSICHPRHHSIYGSDAGTGLEQIPWLETSIYEDLLQRVGGAGLDDLKAHWPELVNEPQPTDTNGINLLLKDVPTFDSQSREKKPAAPLTADGLVGLDGRYLNNAPQCTGWMDLTRDGGSGSFYILWSGLYKLTTAASIPYYTGQYAPSEKNGWSKRGFAMVTIGAGLDDFTAPARQTHEKLSDAISDNVQDTMMQLLITTGILIVLVIFIAIWLASWITGNITRLVKGISRFRAGERHFRFNSKTKDEFGLLADSFDEMAESIVDSVKNPLSILDMNRNIIYMNPSGLRYSGKELEDVTGKSYDEYSAYPVNTEFDPIKALEEERDTEVYYSDATQSYVKGIANWFYDREGVKIGYMVLTADVTDMVMKQQELEKAVNDANSANLHKGEFLARMSHEIRTPMNAIIGITNIVLNKLSGVGVEEENLAEIEAHMQQIETSSQHLLGLLNDILDISKIEAGKIEISEDKMDLIKTITTVEGIIRPRCEEKHLTFNVHIDDFDAQVFMGDQLRLRQVLINLLGNAVKFTPERGRINFTVKKLDREGGQTTVKFTIKDTGIGISDEVREKIFAPFEQATSQITNQYGGTGLGLAISRRIVELMGGDIEVDSTVGKGSTFSFSIRMQEVTDATISDANYSDAIGKFENLRALVVDDIDVNRMIVAGLLAETGIQIEEAEDGIDAVNKFTASPDGWYDIIFMDVQMPRMDGYEATTSIRGMKGREDAKTVKIVALTANAFKEDIDKAKASGMDTHVAKPVEADRLVEVLFEYLN
ncbi:MAG: response regulator [Clostridiales Family XIII bacterium]|jgi:signal transduction histidine kinase/HAMP domain-containing protein|nr:response regulator [Clostridiales Family XIII bacterium]